MCRWHCADSAVVSRPSNRAAGSAKAPASSHPVFLANGRVEFESAAMLLPRLSSRAALQTQTLEAYVPRNTSLHGTKTATTQPTEDTTKAVCAMSLRDTNSNFEFAQESASGAA